MSATAPPTVLTSYWKLTLHPTSLSRLLKVGTELVLNVRWLLSNEIEILDLLNNNALFTCNKSAIYCYLPSLHHQCNTPEFGTSYTVLLLDYSYILIMSFT